MRSPLRHKRLVSLRPRQPSCSPPVSPRGRPGAPPRGPAQVGFATPAGVPFFSLNKKAASVSQQVAASAGGLVEVVPARGREAAPMPAKQRPPDPVSLRPRQPSRSPPLSLRTTSRSPPASMPRPPLESPLRPPDPASLTPRPPSRSTPASLLRCPPWRSGDQASSSAETRRSRSARRPGAPASSIAKAQPPPWRRGVPESVETREMIAGELAALREQHERELLEEAEVMEKEDAIPPGGFWQRLDIECETIGEG